MHNVTIKGAGWTQSHLKRVTSNCNFDIKQIAIKRYWEFTTDSAKSVDEKFMQVLSAIPNGAAYPDMVLYAMLNAGPAFVSLETDPLAKPNLLRHIYDKVGREKFAPLMLNWGKNHKHTPCNTDADWCGLCWLAGVIDIIAVKVKNSDEFLNNLDMVVRNVITTGNPDVIVVH